MKFVPDSIGRSVAGLVAQGQKHSPTLLFGAGVVSMVGSTVLACRATLKLNEVLDEAERDLKAANDVNEAYSEKYSDSDKKKDVALIYSRGVAKTVKLYAPAVIMGGVGIACLTKSQSILKERNAALTAAYIAIDSAFNRYRERVIEKYGEEEDRAMRFGVEEIDIIDEETGKVISTIRAADEDPSGYARWFDAESSAQYTPPPNDEYNWIFLRHAQNWCNDVLQARHHIFLNEVYGYLGLSHTSAGSLVGWIYDRDNDRGDNYIDFGCWGEKDDRQPLDFFNGRDHGILLDFNVDGPIWQLMDERNDDHWS